jgi:hypothetical protein
MRVLIACLIGAATLLAARPAEAIPAFSRRTGMACTSCHDGWPRLNDFGELYRDNGYRTGAADDDSWGHLLEYFPMSFRATVGYRFSSTTNQATDQGKTTVNTGGFATPGADLYFATSLSRHFTIYVDVAGFGPDGTASLESAWVRINEVGTRWVNFKLGRLELDLPVSFHRSYSIFAPFLIYGFHPTGSSSGFDLTENQLGLEISGHDKGPGLRYALAVTTSGEVTSNGVLNAPLLYGHVTYTALLGSRVVPRVRVGAMGNVGWWPTSFKTLTPPGGTPEPVEGTGTNHKIHARTGLDAQLVFGQLARPLTLTAVWMYGQEDAGLIDSGTRTARFHGGFVQLDYTPILPLTVGVRYDGVYNLQQADPAQPSNSGQQDGFSVFGRYALWLSTWGSVVVHCEASTIETKNAATVGQNPVRNTFVFAGIDFLI